MSGDMVNEKSSLITKNLLALKILDEGRKVAIFASFQNEPDTEELVNYFWAEKSFLDRFLKEYLNLMFSASKNGKF